MTRRMIEGHLFESAFAPLDITGAGVDGDWVSMAHGRRLCIVIVTGAWAGGTSAVTVEQATDNAAAGAKALTITEYWQKTAHGAASKFARTAIVAGTFNLSAANKITVIEIDQADLDVSGGFTHVRLRLATPGANADLVGAYYVWEDVVYGGAPETLQDPKG